MNTNTGFLFWQAIAQMEEKGLVGDPRYAQLKAMARRQQAGPDMHTGPMGMPGQPGIPPKPTES